jgi:hypothetical protein
LKVEGAMTGFAALPLRQRALFVLLLVGSAWTGFVFATHTATQPAAGGMWLSLIGFVALALVALYAIGQRKAWAPWTALAVASGMLVIALYGWATKLDAIWPPVTAAVAIAAIGVAFLIGEGASATLTRRQRTFFAIIFLFPAWVAAGGLFLPAQIDQFLPFKVPPLHARFIGAMYIAGAVMMLLAATSRTWLAVRVATVILCIWTSVLGIVSLLHVTAFDWSWRPTWFWWFAYIWFPIGAAFIAWNQRHETGHADEPPLSPLLRGFLVIQGTVAVVLALGLLFVPRTMIGLWPWGITPLLTQIYSAPFLAYGVGSLYAARQHGWSEVRIPVIATLVLTLVAVITSSMHSGLFNAANPSTWVWFCGLGFAALGLAAFVAVPRLRIATLA